jgi:hypothetical protein
MALIYKLVRKELQRTYIKIVGDLAQTFRVSGVSPALASPLSEL